MKGVKLVGVFSFRCLAAAPDFKPFLEYHAARGRVVDESGGHPLALLITSRGLHLLPAEPRTVKSRLASEGGLGLEVYWNVVRAPAAHLREDRPVGLRRKPDSGPGRT